MSAETIMTPDRTIKSICVVFILLFVITLSGDYDLIRFMLNNDHAKYDPVEFLFLIPLIYIPIVVILFYKKKKTGWIMMCIFLSCLISNAIISLLTALTYRPSGIPALNIIFPPPSPGIALGKIFFFALLLFTVAKKEIREIYKASRKNIISSIIIGILFTLGLATGIFG